MAPYLFQFRELFYQLLDVEAEAGAPLLRDWAACNRDILAPYRHFRQLNTPGNVYVVDDGDSERYGELESLYALSRVCDVMLLAFQTGEPWFDLSREQFAEFWRKLGIEAREPTEYHPFWCEIVQCENVADADAPPRVVEVLWPALMWGEMLVCRAGVRVVAGRDWLCGDVAAQSPLYFAYQRNYRKAHDLSHGWGSNSQWGTRFRRDYVWNEFYIFNADGVYTYDEPFLRALNADGTFDPNAPFLQSVSAHERLELSMPDNPRRFFASVIGDDYGLTLAERQELLVNRCWVKRAQEGAEFWPYDDTAIWRQSAALRPECAANRLS